MPLIELKQVSLANQLLNAEHHEYFPNCAENDIETVEDEQPITEGLFATTLFKYVWSGEDDEVVDD